MQNNPKEETNVNTRHKLERPGRAVVLTAAILSTVMAVGIAAIVTGLFQSRGASMAELAVAECASMAENYLSDRERCMREQVAAARGSVVAQR